MLFNWLARRRFSPWLAPLIGAFVAVYGTLQFGILFGMQGTWPELLFAAGIGAVAGSLGALMDYIEHGGQRDTAPNTPITVLVLLIGTALFWVPVVGFVILSYGLYRGRWLKTNEWVMGLFGFMW